MRRTLLAVAIAGCTQGKFVQTDGQYRPARRRTPPGVFYTRAPSRAYRSVGIIEIYGNDLAQVLRAAEKRGQETGCDVVVHRSLYGPTSAIPGAGPLLAQYGARPAYQPPAYQPPPVIVAQPPAPRYEFICGMWTDGPLAPVPPADDDDEESEE